MQIPGVVGRRPNNLLAGCLQVAVRLEHMQIGAMRRRAI